MISELTPYYVSPFLGMYLLSECLICLLGRICDVVALYVCQLCVTHPNLIKRQPDLWFRIGSTNFLIGVAFLPLRNFLARLSFGYVELRNHISALSSSGYDFSGAVIEGSGEGRVFYVFVIAMIGCAAYLSAAWKPSASRS